MNSRSQYQHQGCKNTTMYRQVGDLRTLCYCDQFFATGCSGQQAGPVAVYCWCADSQHLARHRTFWSSSFLFFFFLTILAQSPGLLPLYQRKAALLL